MYTCQVFLKKIFIFLLTELPANGKGTRPVRRYGTRQGLTSHSERNLKTVIMEGVFMNSEEDVCSELVFAFRKNIPDES